MKHSFSFKSHMATSVKPATKKESKKRIQAKTSFNSPFTSQWSQLPQEDMHFILKTLTDKMISTGLEKKEVKVFRSWGKRKEEKPPSKAQSLSQETQGVELSTNGWTDVAARRQLAIGINEVTKALEKNELHLLLVCKSARPNHMTNHLIALSATRGVPACQVPRLSQSLSEPLGLKSVLALGFRRCSSIDQEMFTDTIDAIKPRVPPLDVAWLQEAAPKVPPEVLVGMEEEEEEKMEETERGQKRKQEVESEIPEVPSSCTLQPLKVKRIVANPSKKRKTKPEKKSVK
uniref:Ribonuclease P/MRP 38 subunit n=1 Tax=Oryzias latipes TaxID=8090 RepID=A0A3P9KQF9_ORYLA